MSWLITQTHKLVWVESELHRYIQSSTYLQWNSVTQFGSGAISPTHLLPFLWICRSSSGVNVVRLGHHVHGALTFPPMGFLRMPSTPEFRLLLPTFFHIFGRCQQYISALQIHYIFDLLLQIALNYPGFTTYTDHTPPLWHYRDEAAILRKSLKLP